MSGVGRWGFRYEGLARMFKMHAGLDAGAATAKPPIYFQIGNAWFRP